jgi:hypothetical protein
MDRLNQAVEAANTYSKLSAADFSEILKKTALAAATG